MRLIPVLALVFAGCVFAPKLHAQDSILFNSGQVYPAKVIGVGNPLVNYEETRKNGKKRIRQVDRYRVFSIKFGDERGEMVLYKPDTARGRIWSVEDQRAYVYGQQDALQNTSGTFFTVSGFIYGAAAGYYLADAIWVIPSPLVYPILMLPTASVRKKAVRDPKYLTNDRYREGFKRVARSKKFLNALKGSTIGVVGGFLTYRALN